MAELLATGADPSDTAAVVRQLRQELQQPLHTIESIAVYLDMVLPRTEMKARRQAAKLQHQVHQANWILADVLHCLQAEAPQFQLADLTELVAKTMAEWTPAERQLVRLKLEPDLPPIRADFEQVLHLLRNVVGFFLRITRPDTPVDVATSFENSEVRLEIKANAPGYSVEEVRKLIEPLESRWPTGAGLAMASARRIADVHSARFEVERRPLSCIAMILVFPVAAVEDTASSLASSATA